LATRRVRRESEKFVIPKERSWVGRGSDERESSDGSWSCDGRKCLRGENFWQKRELRAGKLYGM
jgi:hypothetical protein